MEWQDIGTYPTNEYSTEGLLDMEFQTFFPNGDCNWLQPRTHNVDMNRYGLHHLRYCDKIFGIHPRFPYFISNMSMHRRS